MGVTDGMAVNAAITNAAFLNKNQADTMPFLLTSSAGMNFTGTASLGVTNNQTISFESTTWRNYIGAGTGASWTLSKRASSTTLDLFRATDVGVITTLFNTLDDGSGNSSVAGTFTSTGTISGPGSGITAINASNISSGTLSGNRLPNPSASTLGGVESITVVSHNFLTGISTSGVPSQAQPAFTDISGSVAASQLPNPSATTLGGVESIAVVANNFLTGISTSGVPSQAQPAFTNISGSLAGSQLPTFTGDVTNSSAAMTVAKIAGVSVGTPTGTGNVVFSTSPSIAGATHTGTTTFPGTSSIDGSGNAVFGGNGTFTGKATVTAVTASGASSNGTMTVIDTTVSTSTVVLNTSGTATFGNISSQCGLFMVTDEGTGSSALFLAFGSGPTLQVVSQGGSVTFGIAASAANINLYTTANVLTLQNTTGSNKTLKITQIKTG